MCRKCEHIAFFVLQAEAFKQRYDTDDVEALLHVAIEGLAGTRVVIEAMQSAMERAGIVPNEDEIGNNIRTCPTTNEEQ